MGLAAIASHRLGGLVPIGALLKASAAIGRMFNSSGNSASVGSGGGRVLPPVLQ